MALLFIVFNRNQLIFIVTKALIVQFQIVVYSSYLLLSMLHYKHCVYDIF